MEIEKKNTMNSRQQQIKTRFFPLFIFAVSMGFLEAIVVVYLRELYYPKGFEFPLKILPSWLMIIEIIREFSTLLMLFSVSWISGRNFLQRLSVFLFLFGIWDIFYYVALKIFLNWPESFFSWDLLFLIPIAWLGPVLAPLICSLLMIIMTFIFEYFRVKNNSAKVKWFELTLIITGSLIIYITFTFDIGKIILKGNYLKSLLQLPQNKNFIRELSDYVPTYFWWSGFIVGLTFISGGIITFIRRNLSTKNP